MTTYAASRYTGRPPSHPPIAVHLRELGEGRDALGQPLAVCRNRYRPGYLTSDPAAVTCGQCQKGLP